MLSGTFTINGQAAKADDFIVISEEAELRIETEAAGDVFFFASPTKPGYHTYAEMMRHRMHTN